MALSGSYSLVRSEGVLEHLLASGYPEDKAKEAAEGTNKLKISIDGKKVIITRVGGSNLEQSLILNQEIEEKLPGNVVAKTTAELNGDVLTVDSNIDKGNWKREYTITGSELTVSLSSSTPGVPSGKRIYKKD